MLCWRAGEVWKLCVCVWRVRVHVRSCPVCVCECVLIPPWYLKIVKWWKLDIDRDFEQFEVTVQQGWVSPKSCVITVTSKEWSFLKAVTALCPIWWILYDKPHDNCKNYQCKLKFNTYTSKFRHLYFFFFFKCFFECGLWQNLISSVSAKPANKESIQICLKALSKQLMISLLRYQEPLM